MHGSSGWIIKGRGQSGKETGESMPARIPRRQKRYVQVHSGAACGDAYYFGKLYPKETIGDDVRPIEPEDILRAGNLMDGTALLTLLVFGLLKYCMILM